MRVAGTFAFAWIVGCSAFDFSEPGHPIQSTVDAGLDGATSGVATELETTDAQCSSLPSDGGFGVTPQPEAGGASSDGGGALATSWDEDGGARDAGDASASIDAGLADHEFESDGSVDGGADELDAHAGGTDQSTAVVDADGSVAPADSAVHGRVVDFWNVPLSGVAVTLGDATKTTDANGAFAFDSAPSEYNVSFVVQQPDLSVGWRYEGLTRRDPTLQAFVGRPKRDTSLLVSSGVTFASDTHLGVGFGSDNGASFESVTREDEPVITDWSGLESTLATFHALLWETTDVLPTSYLGYDTGSIALSASESGQTLALDLSTSGELSTFNVGGSVTAVTGQQRANKLFVRFGEGDSIQVVDELPGPDEFSYLAPSLPEASVTFAAFEGWFAYEPFAVGYRTGLTPGSARADVSIAEMPQQMAPAPGAALALSDVAFRWQGPSAPVVIKVERELGGERFFIVTRAEEVVFGDFGVGALTLVPGQDYRWQVQYHGAYDSVDEMTASDGFASPFSMDVQLPYGPRAGLGEYAVTASPLFSVTQ